MSTNGAQGSGSNDADRIRRAAPGMGRWDEVEIHAADDPLPVLPDGAEVSFIVTDCAVVPSFDDSWRLMLKCRVLDDAGNPAWFTHDGESLPFDLPFYCKMPPRRGKSGPFKAAPRGSKFYRTWTIANGSRRPLRRDRMTTAVFEGRMFRGTTKVVMRDHQRRALPKELRYSVIEEFLS